MLWVMFRSVSVTGVLAFLLLGTTLLRFPAATSLWLLWIAGPIWCG